MVLNQYKENIMTRLGAPLLDIEVEQFGMPTGLTGVPTGDYNFLDKIIEAAFTEIKEYVDTVYYKTVVAPAPNRKLDLSSEGIRAIVSIFRGQYDLTTAPENVDAMLFSPLTAYQTQSASIGFPPWGHKALLHNYSTSLQYKQLRNQLAQDLDFTYDAINKELYVFQQIPAGSFLTLVYYPDYTDVSQITDSYWQNLLLRLALGFTKETLGRIRGKYRLASAPYEMDYDQLLSEAATEIAEVRNYLIDNNDISMILD